MIKLELFANQIDGPPCGECGGTTRMIGLEQHAVIPQLTVVTLECAACGSIVATIAMAASETHGDWHAR